MQVSRPQLSELDRLLEDAVSHLCDLHQLSGQLIWTVVESYATAKLAELTNDVAPDSLNRAGSTPSI